MICFTKSIRLPVMILLAVTLLAGCGNPAVPAKSPVTTNPSVAPSPTATAQPQATASPTLGDTITLPDGWTMEQAVSVSEIEALVNDKVYVIFPEASSNAANGSPAGGFVKMNANGNMKLTF